MAKPAARSKLRQLYAFKHLTLDAAARKCGVSFSTASRWKRDAAENGDDWDQMRAAHTLAGGTLEDISRQMLTDYLLQHKNMMELIRTDKKMPAEKKAQILASLADSFNKTVAASRRVMPETNQLATAMRILRALAQFITDKYPQHLPAFSEVLQPFGDEIPKVLAE